MRYALTDLEHLQAPVDTVRAALDSKLGDLPSMEQVRALATWDEALLSKFDREVGALEGDRSGAMAELSYLMAEHGWSDEQMYVGLRDVDDRWGKFVGRYNRHSILTDLVNRARQKVGYGFSSIDARAIVERIQNGPAQGRRTRFSWTEFVTADFPVHWQLEGLMPASGIGLVVAPPGTGKSQFALNMGAHLATGRDRFMHWWNRGGPQRVYWLSLEMNAQGLHQFVTTMNPGYFGADDQRLLHQNFIHEALGEAMPLDQEAGQEWFDSALSEVEPDIVMIDSLSMISSKEMTDELSVKEMMSYLYKVRKKHSTSIMMVHHHRKKSTEAGKKHALALDDVYGSRYITAGVDFVLALDKQTEDVIQVRTLKNRYAREDHDFNIIRDGHLMFEPEGAGAQRMAMASGLQI